MLEPHRRAMLLEMLRPPEEYELSLAVGTTYSLDLLALLTAPVAFTLFDQEAVQTDPLGLLHTMRMYADRIRIFCQSGQIKIPREHQLLISYLENSVFEVTAPSDNGVFHPKVWALRYVAEDQQTLYRLLVLSRNLTFDRSWDTSLVLDGVLTDRVNRIGSNSPLGEFFLSLPELAKNPLPETVTEELDLIGDEIQKVEWELPDQFESIKFWALGLPNRRRRWPFKGRVDQMAVIAPFISEGLLKELAPAGKDNILVSRTDAIENLTSDSFDRFNEIYAFNPGITTEEEAYQTEKPALVDVPDTGLHAKLFIGDMGYEARLWTGSANATRAAFYENVEFLVEFQGRKSQMGIKALFKDSDNGQVNFKDLLQSISGPPEDTSVNPLHGRLESQLRQARQVITKMGFHLRADEIGQNDYNLILESRSPGELDSNLAVNCWPITLEEEHYRLNLEHPFKGLIFTSLSVPALTSFLAFSVTAQEQGETLSTRFVLNLPLVGLPDDRAEMILKEILKDRQQFLRYLLMLLQEDHKVGLPGEFLSGGGSASSGLPGSDLSLPLLELLLSSLARAPEQLDKVQGLVEDLKNTPEGEKLLPDNFAAVWDPIWETRQQLRRKS